MKYFEPGDILLTDFDGVFVDSQERFLEVMQDETSFELWMEYLNSINWKEFLRECEEMPNATEVFLELQELGILQGFITKIHSFEEGKEKCLFIRDKGLYVPIYYVLPEQAKSSVYIPRRNVVLLDDIYENAFDWEMNGGKSIIFNQNNKTENKKMIKRLDSLLTK